MTAAVACAACLLGVGCQSRQSAPVAPPVDPCAIVNDEPAAFTAALDAPVVATTAPVPSSAADRLVFAQLYDTLVRVDCTGAVLPRLASAWSDSAGMVWRFVMRPELSFSDGTQIDARAVMQSWSRSTVANAFTSLTVSGDRELRAELREPVAASFFAHPALAVGGPLDDGWPAASTPWRIVAGGSTPALIPDGDAGRAVAFRVYARDMRIAIDEGAGMIVSPDVALADHAVARGGYTITPLPWTRTYVVATAARGDAAAVTDAVATALTHAVRASVRPAQQPFWWQAAGCGVPGVPFRAAREARDVVYLRGDDAARALAERIAAQAWPPASAAAWLRAMLPPGYGAGGAPRAVPLDEPALTQAIRARLPLAVVAELPRLPDPGCATGARTVGTLLLGSGWQLTPLLDARDLLLHRAGLGRVTIDAYGSIYIHLR